MRKKRLKKFQKQELCLAWSLLAGFMWRSEIQICFSRLELKALSPYTRGAHCCSIWENKCGWKSRNVSSPTSPCSAHQPWRGSQIFRQAVCLFTSTSNPLVGVLQSSSNCIGSISHFLSILLATCHVNKEWANWLLKTNYWKSTIFSLKKEYHFLFKAVLLSRLLQTTLAIRVV